MGNIKSFKVLIALSLFISFFVGIRFFDVGTDSEQYRQHFYNASTDRFSVGFALLMQLFSRLTSSVELFFFFISFLITTVYLHFFKSIYLKCFYGDAFQASRMLIFFSLLLISSWYITSITNGLRQGVALVFLYVALYELFYNRNKFKFSVLYLLSLSFHVSSVLVAPFLLLYLVQFRIVFILWLLIGVGYFTGINESVVKMISNSYNLGVHEYIKFYSLERGTEDFGGGLYEGFIFEFFIYTLFWPILLLAIIKIKFRFKSDTVKVKNVYTLLKIYCLLSMPYFIFGFGPFSNRYAMFAWFLVPVLQFFILNIIIFRSFFSLSLAIPFLLVTLMYFLLFRLDWIRVFF